MTTGYPNTEISSNEEIISDSATVATDGVRTPHDAAVTAPKSTRKEASSPDNATASFATLGLHQNLLATITAVGYTAPTPIQEQAIPTIISGRDVVGLAQTGTGKTAAFVLPILHRLADKEPGTLRVLVIVPTRELAEQVCSAVRTLSQGSAIRSMTMYGGVRNETQVRQLKQRPDIIVGCPGRILDHMEQGTLKLNSVDTLVLDEADQMFDMGFIVPIRRIIKALPQQRQNLLFSATMPAEVRELTRETLKDPVRIQVAPITSPDTVTHIAYPVTQHRKSELLKRILSEISSESVLVFTRTKHRAKKIASFLDQNGITATSLQGNLSQSQRANAMRGFRSGKFTVMVATDIASRGIDISSISHVVNFDLPDTIEAYLHRVGRTGRAQRTGDALSFISPDDEMQLRRVEGVLKLQMPRKYVDGFDYAAKNTTPDSRFDGDARRRGAGGRFGGGRSGGGRSGGGRGSFGSGERRSFGDRPQGERSFGERPARSFDRSDAPRGESSERPRFNRSEGAPRSFGDRPSFSGPRSEGRGPRSDRPAYGDRPSGGRGGRFGGRSNDRGGFGSDRPAFRGPPRRFEGNSEGNSEGRPAAGERAPWNNGNREGASDAHFKRALESSERGGYRGRRPYGARDGATGGGFNRPGASEGNFRPERRGPPRSSEGSSSEGRSSEGGFSGPRSGGNRFGGRSSGGSRGFSRGGSSGGGFRGPRSGGAAGGGFRGGRKPFRGGDAE